MDEPLINRTSERSIWNTTVKGRPQFWTIFDPPSPNRQAFYYYGLSTASPSPLRLWRHLWTTPNLMLMAYSYDPSYDIIFNWPDNLRSSVGKEDPVFPRHDISVGRFVVSEMIRRQIVVHSELETNNKIL